MGGVTAPSRPPSRAQGSVIDLSADHATALASARNVSTLKEQEENDPELQRAMAESLRQTHPAQENGVTQTGGQFGPATRDFYDESSWAMTTYSTSREIIEHPPPSKRRRVGDAPAFLRDSKDTGFLGSLLTIYHNIPLAREALLMPSMRVHAYAHDASWWSGATDENTKALSTDNTLRIDQNERNLLTEVQCLMAFLDRTTRAYGSVDALADLQAVRNRPGDALYHKFLEGWGAAALKQAPSDQLTQVFSSIAMKASGPNEDTAVEKTLCYVEPYINHHPNETLTDLLDNSIWNDEMGSLDDVWISHCAEIFTIRLQDPNTTASSVDISLEPVWYADRYMYQCRDEMKQIRRQLQTTRRQIEQLTHVQRRFQFLSLPNNRVLDVSETLNAAMKASTIAASRTSEMDSDGRSPESNNAVAQSDIDELNTELQNVIDNIRQRLSFLEQRKEELRIRSRQITMQLTKPTPERPDVPHRQYTLQGVATKPGITYFRRQASTGDLLDLEEDQMRDDTGYEWWRTSWQQEEAQQAAFHPPMMGPVTLAQAEAAYKAAREELTPHSVSQVTEAEVLDAVKNEHNSVILVFANENAMNFPHTEPSLSLRAFVDRDNQVFAEDLQEEEGPLAASSGEHDAETEFEDVPLIDPTASNSSVRELTPMATSSSDQDEDRDESPNRAQIIGAGNVLEQPPPYEDSVGKPEMTERKENKIGLYAEQLLQRYGNEIGKGTDAKEDSGDLSQMEDSH